MTQVDMVCVDASFYVSMMMPDEDSIAADSAWEAWVNQQTCIHAPSLFVWECLNAVRRAVVDERLSHERGDEIRSVVLRAPVRLIHMENRAEAVWASYVQEFDLSTVYDALYLTLADDLDCELWTEDQRLYRSVHEHLPWVRCASLEA